MTKRTDVYLHHNRGVPALRFTVRVDREIRHVRKAAWNGVLVGDAGTYLVTKGTCAKAAQLGRLKLTPYVGNWPRLAVLWARLKEVVRG